MAAGLVPGGRAVSEADRERADNDRKLAELRDFLPALWWALYSGCLEKGFSEIQALELVKVFITKPQ